jgi:hypothetical protein
MGLRAPAFSARAHGSSGTSSGRPAVAGVHLLQPFVHGETVDVANGQGPCVYTTWPENLGSPGSVRVQQPSAQRVAERLRPAQPSHAKLGNA